MLVLILCLFLLHCIPASQRGGPPLGAASAASIKPKLNGSQPPQTPTRSSLMGLPPTSASRLPRKTQGPSRSLAEANVHGELGSGAGRTKAEPNKDSLCFWKCIVQSLQAVTLDIKSVGCRLLSGVRPVFIQV